MRLESHALSGILTIGGTILGTSRVKPHRMQVGSKVLNMTDVVVDNYTDHQLDALVCLGGGGTQKNALRLKEAGLNIITLPKTIDNDVAVTDITFGFDTALSVAVEAIDRLHSTAHSHHRIIVVEIMGHRVGWLTLGAGLAGGADVILIPEIPYNVESIADAIRQRSRSGKRFSIVAVSEGAMTKDELKAFLKAEKKKKEAKSDEERKKALDEFAAAELKHENNTLRLSKRLEELTGLEARITILGHVQRGGAPSAADRILATHLGTTCTEFINDDIFGVMVSVNGQKLEAVPLEDVAGKRKFVPLDHPWIESARRVGVCLGD
jgi:6-phosphofructokinase 1